MATHGRLRDRVRKRSPPSRPSRPARHPWGTQIADRRRDPRDVDADHGVPQSGSSMMWLGVSRSSREVQPHPNEGKRPPRCGYASTPTQYVITPRQVRDYPNEGTRPPRPRYTTTPTQVHDHPDAGTRVPQRGCTATPTRVSECAAGHVDAPRCTRAATRPCGCAKLTPPCRPRAGYASSPHHSTSAISTA